MKETLGHAPGLKGKGEIKGDHGLVFVFRFGVMTVIWGESRVAVRQTPEDKAVNGRDGPGKGTSK